MRIAARKTTGKTVVSSRTSSTRSSRPTPSSSSRRPARLTSHASASYVSERSSATNAIFGPLAAAIWRSTIVLALYRSGSVAVTDIDLSSSPMLDRLQA